MANIFVFSNLKEKHRITYESYKEDAFLVHTKTGINKFDSKPAVIYALKPPISYMKNVEEKNITPSNGVSGIEHSNMLSTVKESWKGYTLTEI